MQHEEYAGAPPGALVIPLRAKGGKVRFWVWVDEADFIDLAQFNWSLNPDGYARRNLSWSETGGKPGTMLMHRQIMGLQKGDKRVVDHINRDKLDNRRENLRVIDRKQNGENQGCNYRENRSSKYRGVSYHKRSKKFMAYCRLDGHLHHLGYFEDEEDAAKAAAEFRAVHMPFSEEAA